MKINLPLLNFNIESSPSSTKVFCCCVIFVIKISFTQLVNFINNLISNKLKEALIKQKNDLEAKKLKRKEDIKNGWKKILQPRSFKEDVAITRRVLDNLDFPKKLAIGKFEKALKMENPFQDDYDALSEDCKRKLNKENSLFLSEKLDKDSMIEIMKNSERIESLARADLTKQKDKRFVRLQCGRCAPIFDIEKNVIYKIGKNPYVDVSSSMIRHHLNKLGIENITLPLKETWATRDKDALLRFKSHFHMKDSSDKMIPIIIEDAEKGILDAFDCEKIYMSSPQLFDDIVTSITRLFCFIEIGDLTFKRDDTSKYRFIEENPDIDLEIRTKIDLIKQSDNKYVVQPDCADFPGICRFDNLPIQAIENSDGSKSYKFVLADIDVVRKPDHKTVEMLLRMFPKHQQLIVDVVQDTNPDLFEYYRHDVGSRYDFAIPPGCFLSTKDEIIEQYKKEKAA